MEPMTEQDADRFIARLNRSSLLARITEWLSFFTIVVMLLFFALKLWARSRQLVKGLRLAILLAFLAVDCNTSENDVRVILLLSCTYAHWLRSRLNRRPEHQIANRCAQARRL